jgi:hypothetical protein
MLREITLNDSTIDYIADDPVRPRIPKESRMQGNKRVYYLSNQDNDMLAIVCVAFTDQVATTELELDRCMTIDGCSVCMFYTIWSYAPGAGRELALKMLEYIKDSFPQVKRVVTLSPKTEMARKFHLKNGATELQENLETVNFEYQL